MLCLPGHRRHQRNRCGTTANDHHALARIVQIFRPLLRMDDLTLECISALEGRCVALVIAIVASGSENPVTGHGTALSGITVLHLHGPASLTTTPGCLEYLVLKTDVRLDAIFSSGLIELKALLDVSARSISAFIDRHLEDVAALMSAEKSRAAASTHVERRELVTRILEGANVGVQEGSRRLGYALKQRHYAAVVWSEEAASELSTLDEAAGLLLKSMGNPAQHLRIIANAATLWVWSPRLGRIDYDALLIAIQSLPGIKIAIGSADSGIEGFRRAHLDALATQQVLARLDSPARVADFDSIRLVSLMSRDPEATQRFISYTLGDFLNSTQSQKRTLLTFLRTGCHATRTAKILHTHRNTLLLRLARADELLPRPLEDNRVHVAVALEALNWTSTDGPTHAA